MAVPRFALDEEDAFQSFLKSAPRVVVLFRGVGCPYSATFESVFIEEPVPGGWVLAIRIVEEGGHGPVAERHGVELTPTVDTFVEGAKSARLPGKLLLGIGRTAYRRWLKSI